MLLVTFEMLGIFVNALTAYDKYSRHDREKSWQQIPMGLSQKQKTFSQFFIAFLNFTSNFFYFEKKD